jgi:hypothetical protein
MLNRHHASPPLPAYLELDTYLFKSFTMSSNRFQPLSDDEFGHDSKDRRNLLGPTSPTMAGVGVVGYGSELDRMEDEDEAAKISRFKGKGKAMYISSSESSDTSSKFEIGLTMGGSNGEW